METHGDDYLQQAQRLHQQALVVDTHCDTTQRLMDPRFNLADHSADGHVDIPRLREGGVDAVFFAVWAPGPVEPGAGLAAARAQISRIHEVISSHPDDLMAARSARDVRRAKADGRIAVLIAVEGGYLIEDSLDVLREYHRSGASYLTLTHSFHTSWADSSGVHESLTPRHGGLTEFGKDVVRELNRLGMMVDISHVSDETFRDVMETTSAPVIASHSSCRAVAAHRRNLSDEMIKAVAESGGVVQINFASLFVDGNHPPVTREMIEQWWATGGRHKQPISTHVTPLRVLVDHFDHALKLVGPEHVGIGSDFDGVPALPADMEDCSKLPNLTAELLRRGHDQADLTRMLGENVLRVMDACADIARRLRREPPGGHVRPRADSP